MQTRGVGAREHAASAAPRANAGPIQSAKDLAASLRIAPMRLHSERSNRIMFMHFERAADSLVIVLEGHLTIYLLLLDNYLEGSPFLHLSEALAEIKNIRKVVLLKFRNDRSQNIIS